MNNAGNYAKLLPRIDKESEKDTAHGRRCTWKVGILGFREEFTL